MTNLKDLEIDHTANGYYLPTSVQWEYAVRGGTTDTWFWGNDSTDADAYAWYWDNSDIVDGRTTHPVGQKKSNEFGLYDMAGNVWEWCEAGSRQSLRIIRGGSFDFSVGNMKSSYLNEVLPVSCKNRFGFRVVKGGRPESQ
ncbi:putative serine/threonine-protein kinase pknB [Chitinivibrio alkaliphilus ACht1]|uniref:Putative serine/threonine-protein kinase pknB n=1 Tax=Chitinivibrio alkaliphilus ACht1 TaxID=1313304 RepID=U7D3Q6_9BACT|nr:putative serine/threonine-protein kinase pknB [Chitinivibrio alkaliphilus ACht1]